MTALPREEETRSLLLGRKHVAMEEEKEKSRRKFIRFSIIIATRKALRKLTKRLCVVPCVLMYLFLPLPLPPQSSA